VEIITPWYLNGLGTGAISGTVGDSGKVPLGGCRAALSRCRIKKIRPENVKIEVCRSNFATRIFVVRLFAKSVKFGVF